MPPREPLELPPVVDEATLENVLPDDAAPLDDVVALESELPLDGEVKPDDALPPDAESPVDARDVELADVDALEGAPEVDPVSPPTNDEEPLLLAVNDADEPALALPALVDSGETEQATPKTNGPSERRSRWRAMK